jgi:hypothetical protein
MLRPSPARERLGQGAYPDPMIKSAALLHCWPGVIRWSTATSDWLGCRPVSSWQIELFGLRIWGTPWQPWFYDWAFNAPRRNGEEFLASEFDTIPAGTDVVVAYGPPHGFGDRTSRQGGHAHVGSTAMTAALERVQPRVMVCGHIHPADGQYRLGATEIINASLVNEDYRPVNPVVEIEL